MNIIDEAKIYLESGSGGNGCVSFRREKSAPDGGPNGGDGGRGGSIILVSDASLNTLGNLRYKRIFRAQAGEKGKGSNCTGKSGEDLILKIPVGTQIYEAEQNLLLFDFTADDQSFEILKGGDGGLGNTHFKSSRNQAPKKATPGHPGAELWVWLKLKLLSDVGIIGLPNAGKSTLLAKITNARPKIADYPFTTLSPNLGIAQVKDRELVIADIPGLIEGAHLGHGLGDKFLKHIERCRILVHLIDINAKDVVDAYQTIRNELTSYSDILTQKTEIICLNKCETLKEEEVQAKYLALKKATKQEIYLVSTHIGEGLEQLLQKILEQALASGAVLKEF